jgi:predicted RND superfamily exporter protein
MTRRVLMMGLLGSGVLVAALGVGRLRFDPDILGMLPPDAPEVRGLRAFHAGFAKADELVVLIEGGAENEGLMPEAAQSLATALEASGVAKRARWQPRWTEEGEGMAELLAYFWLNGPRDAVREKSAALAPPQARATLDRALADVATALEGEDLAMRAHDPLGFLRHPAIDSLLAGAADGVDGYESADGRAHLLFVEAPRAVPGYRNAGAWINEVRAVMEEWRKSDGAGITVHLTGEPAFSSEIGGAMEHDMRGTVGITAGLIALLFWVMQRRLVLLGGLAVVLVLVFLTALGLAGWIYGELSIMAAGFAAILIGLAVDYGVLICQEGKVAGRGSAALWRATATTVCWAAFTTAVVFLALNRSGLPGIAQLGTVVACGIVAGAALMLGYYLPFVAWAGAGRGNLTGGHGMLPRRTTALVLAALLAVAALGSLLWRGMPGVDFDERMLRPRDSRAMAAFDKVREVFPQWGTDALRLVVEAPDDASMQRLLAEAQRRIEANPVIDTAVMPSLWWPDASRQQANRADLREIAERSGSLLESADAAGFSEEGLALGRKVLEQLQTATTAENPYYPSSPAAHDILRMFVSRNESGGGCLAGVVKPAAEADPAGRDYQALGSLNGGGIWLAGWELLKPAVVPLVRRDVTEVFLPMAALMVAMLTVIFRSLRVVSLCLAAMALSGLILLAAMSWLGIGWNFLNIAATPLLLGTGIDYGIHIGLALRRNGGDVAAMWHGTGKAVMFCGVSTAIGFGSLCFASNDAMTSLGVVALIGILTTMAVSVFLLPPLLAPSRIRKAS